MHFLYPVTDATNSFTELELKGMQALALNRQKEAEALYDKVVLADPRKETLLRIVRQYEAAGLLGSADCSGYYVMACNREKLDNGRHDSGSFQYALDCMRKKHQTYLKSQHQAAVKQAASQRQKIACSSISSSPRYDEGSSEETALLSGAKSNQSAF